MGAGRGRNANDVFVGAAFFVEAVMRNITVPVDLDRYPG
jgi:hypothetical protein